MSLTIIEHQKTGGGGVGEGVTNILVKKKANISIYLFIWCEKSN